MNTHSELFLCHDIERPDGAVAVVVYFDITRHSPGAKPIRNDIWGGDPGYPAEYEFKFVHAKLDTCSAHEPALASAEIAALRMWFDRTQHEAASKVADYAARVI